MADERSRVEATRRCLDGLSVGDGFGECFFHAPREWIAERRLPDGPWRWTDDTAMAVSIVEELVEGGSPVFNLEELAEALES